MQKKCIFLHPKQETTPNTLAIPTQHPRNTLPISTQYPPNTLAIPSHHAGCKPLRRAPPDRLAAYRKTKVICKKMKKNKKKSLSLLHI